jgi:hypothetical protein
VAFLKWRFGLTRMPPWRIEVAPFPGLSNVATPTKAIITIPMTLYGCGNGDDAEEGGPEGCAMGGSMGSASATKPVAVAVPLGLAQHPSSSQRLPGPRGKAR